MTRRTGRRPGHEDTRAAILAAAREVFAARGYDGATIRGIAAGAGVDPALVHHYFGSKQQLFTATVEFPVDPEPLLAQILAGDREEVGTRLVGTFVSTWDSPVGAAGVALVRSAVTNDDVARLLREFLTTQILRRALRTLDVPSAEAPLRGALAASQIAGLAVMRYLLRMEPLASAEPATVVATVGPTVQRYLTGPLPPQARPAT